MVLPGTRRRNDLHRKGTIAHKQERVMKQKLKTLILLTLSILLISCTNVSPRSRSESYLFTQKLGAGWNLGNTLDAYNDSKGKGNYGLTSETCWNMPLTTKEMIHEIKAKGFKTIRIPVSWHNHITDEKLTIDSAWMARVTQIVDWAMEENLYVILNIHHDNIKSSDLNKTYGYTLNENLSDRETSINYITSVWKQVAGNFSEYDDHLIFETLNEPRNRDGINDGFTAPENIRILNRTIVKYNQAAVDTIRESGGMNANRYIMVPCYAASPYDDTGWKEPEDSAENKILISVHAYTPYTFCMSDSSNKTFDVYQEGNDISYLFSMLDDKWGSRGYGLVIGETSASDKNNLSERLEWVNYFYKLAQKNSCAVILWDNMTLCKESGGKGDINSGECHGYFNRSNLSWYFPSLVEKMIKLCE